MTILTLDWHLQKVDKCFSLATTTVIDPWWEPSAQRLMGSECGRYIREAPEQLALCHSLIITAIMIKITLAVCMQLAISKHP